MLIKKSKNNIRFLNTNFSIDALLKVVKPLSADYSWDKSSLNKATGVAIANIIGVDTVNTGEGTNFTYVDKSVDYDNEFSLGTYYGKTMLIILEGEAEIMINDSRDESLFVYKMAAGRVLGFEEDEHSSVYAGMKVPRNRNFKALVLNVSNFREVAMAENPNEFLF